MIIYHLLVIIMIIIGISLKFLTFNECNRKVVDKMI